MLESAAFASLDETTKLPLLLAELDVNVTDPTLVPLKKAVNVRPAVQTVVAPPTPSLTSANVFVDKDSLVIRVTAELAAGMLPEVLSVALAANNAVDPTDTVNVLDDKPDGAAGAVFSVK